MNTIERDITIPASNTISGNYNVIVQGEVK